MTEHSFIKTKNGWKCEICEWEWKCRSVTECPELPRYSWWEEYRKPPEHFRTIKQLKKERLNPSEPRGVVMYGSPLKPLYLYDVREATPRIVNPRQLAAIKKAREVLDKNAWMLKYRRRFIDSYRDGLIELSPHSYDYEGESIIYWWEIKGIYLKTGDAFCIDEEFWSDKFKFNCYTKAFKFASGIMDWIIDNMHTIVESDFDLTTELYKKLRVKVKKIEKDVSEYELN